MLQQSGFGIAVTGSGSCTPQVSLDNNGLSQIVDTSDEWIGARTGIRSRRLADDRTSLCDLAFSASRKAIEMAEISPTDIDLIILATSSPDDLFGTAGKIQYQLGATKAVAFDLTAACSGFVFGLVTASQFIRTGVYQNTCILFGDGAGAVVLQASEVDRFLGFEIRSDGTQNSSLNLAYKAESKSLIEGVNIGQGGFEPIAMNGQEIYRFAVKKVPEVIEKAMFRANISAEKIDWLLLHQANQRILDAVAQRLKIPPEKVISNLANYGNTSAASIPLALDESVRLGKVKSGDTIAAAGFGAGLSWGAAIFQWGR
ncbi:MAG: ketoacyl-ACP synthase III [Oscillatoriales cyanobacterium]|nr:MAG: ketoacyl-ACP synthase III [Oscillatoriales cyanobacterium]